MDLCNRTVVHNSNYLYCFPFKGCNGGWPQDAYKYVQRTGGLATEHSYPLNRKGEGKCNKKVPHSGTTCSGFKRVQKGDENALKAAIALQVTNDYNIMKTFCWIKLYTFIFPQGPHSVVVDASSWGFYHSGVFNGHGCSSDPMELIKLNIKF